MKACGAAALLLLLPAPALAVEAGGDPDSGETFVVTQLPLDAGAAERASATGGMLPSLVVDGARIVLVEPRGTSRVLTGSFHAARDPEISFDGERMLFAGKRKAEDRWNVFEMALDGSEVRQITEGPGDCRNPLYLGSFFTIDSPEPRRQIAFVSDGAGEWNEYGPVPSTNLYSCGLDGSELRRLTFNPSSDLDPTILPDGRLLFSSWQRGGLERGFRGRVSLFTAQTDGLDYAIFAGDEGLRVKLMPCVTTEGLVVFVEGDGVARDGSGSLASVGLRRNLHSYRRITTDADGLFHSPSPLPDGKVLVSRRPAGGKGTHAVHRLDPRTGRFEMLFDDPDRHDVQARIVAPRPRPDGRSSVLAPENPKGKLYCLNVYRSDRRGWVARGATKRLRVIEGLPRTSASGTVYLPAGRKIGVSGPGSSSDGIPPLLRTRILGVVPVEEDGSFNIEVPANTPIRLQLLDEDGLALETCGWIWARNRETRGCIGCHEDPESTPENRFVKAVAKPSIPVDLAPTRRRTVDFRRDILPVLSARCASATCHGGGAEPLLVRGPRPADPPGDAVRFDPAYEALLAADPANPSSPWGRYVHPGRARTSPLVWHVLGRNTSRPWDGAGAREAAPMPPGGAATLTDDEKRAIAEWIDLGAMWSGGAGQEGAGGAR